MGTNNQAELFAIFAAVSILDNHYTLPRIFVFCVDSEYAIGLLSKHHTPKTNFLLTQEVKKTLRLSKHTFSFLHSPSHCGIFGNEVADWLADFAARNQDGKEVASPAERFASLGPFTTLLPFEILLKAFYKARHLAPFSPFRF